MLIIIQDAYQRMSQNLHRRQRPASLQLVSTYGAFSTPTQQAPVAIGQLSELPSITHSLVLATATRAGSPKRSTSQMNHIRPTVLYSTSRSRSPTETIFVTIVSTKSGSEGKENDSPSPTTTIFFSVAPQMIFTTISVLPSMTTVVAGNTGIEGSQIGPEKGLSLTRTARDFLITLGAVCR
ncbi:hypothetical protein M3J09_005065 [Ascochyta lentis]